MIRGRVFCSPFFLLFARTDNSTALYNLPIYRTYVLWYDVNRCSKGDGEMDYKELIKNALDMVDERTLKVIYLILLKKIKASR